MYLKSTRTAGAYKAIIQPYRRKHSLSPDFWAGRVASRCRPNYWSYANHNYQRLASKPFINSCAILKQFHLPSHCKEYCIRGTLCPEFILIRRGGTEDVVDRSRGLSEQLDTFILIPKHSVDRFAVGPNLTATSVVWDTLRRRQVPSRHE